MKTAVAIMCVLTGMVMLVPLALAEDQRPVCPLRGNDACDQWDFEQAEIELNALLARAVPAIQKFAYVETREEASALFLEAQRHWVEFRDSNCKARAARLFMRSASTKEGQLSACLNMETRQRIQDITQELHLGE